ncbi:MAG: DUF4012 domain-containing protein, partial [Patescibacteria group bacterium]
MKRHRPQLRTLLQIIGIIAAVLSVIAGVVAWNYRDIRAVVDSSLKAREALLLVQEDVSEMRLRDAKTDIVTAQAALSRALMANERIQELRWIPFAARQLAGVRTLLVATDEAADAVERVIDLGADLEEIAGTSAFAVFSDLTADQKHLALKRINESVPDLSAAKAQVGLAMQTLAQLPRFGLLPQFKLATIPLKEQLPKISSAIEEVIPYAKALPAILGYPTEHQMLLLLQNNTELRPTGGFIGTYGVVVVKDAALQSMKTENVYELDRRSDPKDRPASPTPLATYLNPRWFFRDANWDPDFPSSAETLLQFYREEGGVGDFQSVVAITPQVIVSLLELVGDVTVDGVMFTSDNVVGTLEYEVERGYAKDGIADIDRKDIVGKLAGVLVERIFHLPKERMPILSKIFNENIQQKHLLIYFEDPELQKWARGEGWAGEVKPTAADALMVVDANMASLKTDAVMERFVDYHVNLGETSTAELNIRYKNNGEFRWDQTRYRTYTRVYVPKGSQLLTSSGAMTNDRIKRGQPTDATVTEEQSRTVFNAFISIEPGEEGVLKFQYTLPTTIADRWRNGAYDLLVQKQSGTLGQPLTVRVKSDKKITEATPADSIKIYDNE